MDSIFNLLNGDWYDENHFVYISNPLLGLSISSLNCPNGRKDFVVLFMDYALIYKRDL